MKLDYKKLSLKFACNYCSPITARDLLRSKGNKYRLLHLLVNDYSYNSYSVSDLSQGELSYLKKVIKGIQEGGLDNALWIN